MGGLAAEAGSERPRIGLLGGTFDPPHYGHLVAAQESAWRLNLTRVLFLPARLNPLKRFEATSDPEDRFRMVALAIEGNPKFEASPEDMHREPPSYTVDLLTALRTRYGEDTDLFFIAGADIVPDLPSWRQPEEVLRMATLVTLTRPGWPDAETQPLQDQVSKADGRLVKLRIPGIDISSTEIRDRVAAGYPIRYLTPRSVEEYILARHLYQ